MRIILSGYTGHMGREVRASAERAGYPIVAGVDAMAKEYATALADLAEKYPMQYFRWETEK